MIRVGRGCCLLTLYALTRFGLSRFVSLRFEATSTLHYYVCWFGQGGRHLDFQLFKFCPTGYGSVGNLILWF